MYKICSVIATGKGTAKNKKTKKNTQDKCRTNDKAKDMRSENGANNRTLNLTVSTSYKG